MFYHFRPLHHPPLKTSLVPETKTKPHTTKNHEGEVGNVEITELGSSPRLPKNDQSEKSTSKKFQNFLSTSKKRTHLYVHPHTHSVSNPSCYTATFTSNRATTHSSTATTIITSSCATLRKYRPNYATHRVDIPSNKIMQPSINILGNPKIR